MGITINAEDIHDARHKLAMNEPRAAIRVKFIGGASRTRAQAWVECQRAIRALKEPAPQVSGGQDVGGPAAAAPEHPHVIQNRALEHAAIIAEDHPEIARRIRALQVSGVPTPNGNEVELELERAVAKFPTWPTDPLHALAVLGEEFGELTKAMLQLTYEPHKTSADEVRTEALQTAAMALRLFRSLGCYEYRPGQQHEQRADQRNDG